MVRDSRRDALPCEFHVAGPTEEFFRESPSLGDNEEVEALNDALSLGKVLCRRSDAGLDEIDSARNRGWE